MSPNDTLEGRRVLVVGATSGIGRAVVGAAEAGAHVVAVGRRVDRLDDLVAEGHGDVVAMAGDVRADDDCRRMVDDAVNVLGGLDALLYASGVSPLGRLLDTSGDDWRRVFETNVVGASLGALAALAHLEASSGRAVFLSSVSSDDPRPFLVPYGASKAALDALIRGWRSEHPHLCFVRVAVGPTTTEFGSGWDPAMVGELTQVRAERGLLRPTPMTPPEVAAEVLRTLTSPVWAEDIRLMPRNLPDGAAI